MLLVNITLNGVQNYVSMDGYALTNNWRPLVLGVSSPTYAASTDHGGLVKMQMGTITFNPSLFSSYWPPPIYCPIAFYWTDTTEAAATTVFWGYAHLQMYDRVGVTYSLYPPAYAEMTNAMIGIAGDALVVGKWYSINTFVAGDNFNNVNGGVGAGSSGLWFAATGTTPTTWTNKSQVGIVSYSGQLIPIITDLVGYITELAGGINTTYASATYNVAYACSQSILTIDLIDQLCQNFCHIFYIVGTTGYLVSMTVDNAVNGTLALTEYDFLASPKYIYKSPICKMSSDTYMYPNWSSNPTTAFPVSYYSGYSYGSEASITSNSFDSTNLWYNLQSIVTLENQMRISIQIPMKAGYFPVPGQRITFTDTSTLGNLTGWLRVRKMQYDFSKYVITVEGEGGVS
jgi:hypothetical protein